MGPVDAGAVDWPADARRRIASACGDLDAHPPAPGLVAGAVPRDQGHP